MSILLVLPQVAVCRSTLTRQWFPETSSAIRRHPLVRARRLTLRCLPPLEPSGSHLLCCKRIPARAASPLRRQARRRSALRVPTTTRAHCESQFSPTPRAMAFNHGRSYSGCIACTPVTGRPRCLCASERYLSSRPLPQPRSPHWLRARFRSRNATTSTLIPATKSTATATARYCSVVFNSWPSLGRPVPFAVPANRRDGSPSGCGANARTR